MLNNNELTLVPAQIGFSGLYLDGNATQLGGVRSVYSNGVMTGVFYLGWTYYNPDSTDTTTADQVVSYLKTAGNIDWRFGDKSGDKGSLADAGWTVGVTDNGYAHDIVQQTGPAAESPEVSLVNLSGIIPFYILPVLGYANTSPIYCKLTDGTASTMATGNQSTQLAGQVWQHNSDSFAFSTIVDNGGSNGCVLRELRWSDYYISESQNYSLIKTNNIIPSTSTWINTAYLPFDAAKGGSGRNIFLIYNAPTDTTLSQRSVFVLDKLTPTYDLAALNEEEYACNQEYTFLLSNKALTSSQYPQGYELENFDWDPKSISGIPIATQYKKGFIDPNGSETNPASVFQYIQNDIPVDYAHTGDYIPGIRVLDNFGTVIDFVINLDGGGDDKYTWTIESAAPVFLP
ncbi:hypothetical protein [Edaphovirga cremea]|uniref:hypothetical protein n=1 Tax=Edaphovirga cremea TaxID=2267246 RepID=UPI0013001A2F|nr:hypothetical protein [Edaphovirga cremea]